MGAAGKTPSAATTETGRVWMEQSSGERIHAGSHQGLRGFLGSSGVRVGQNTKHSGDSDAQQVLDRANVERLNLM